jgi:ABC-type transport system substrate-binding protein
MNDPMKQPLLLLLCLILLLGQSCKSEDAAIRSNAEISVRLPADPDRLNPMLTSVAYATDVLRYTHFPLLEFHPLTLELQPIVAEALPVVEKITEGPFAGGEAYHYRIRPEATWDDGTPITGADYVFTLKTVFHPIIKANAWQSRLAIIGDVVLDPENPRNFTVYTREAYFLSLATTGNLNLYPKHKYDPQGLMDHVALTDLLDPEKGEALAATDEKLLEFATLFTSDNYSRNPEYVSGCGPYQLESWSAGEELVLVRKENWWGHDLAAEDNQFTARPARIRFKIIADEQSAMSLLMSGGLDLLGGVSPELYQSLSDSLTVDASVDTYLSSFIQYTMVALNNRNPKLSDPLVRRALALVTPVDQIIDNVLVGLGQRMTGPFHPSRAYTNKELKPIPYDPAEARRLLQQAGWTDTNNNGIVDKVIDGTLVEMELTMMTRPGSDVANNIILLMQKGAREAGIEIKVETKDFKLIMGDLARRDYDMTLSSLRQSPAEDDPYQTWHSSSDTPDGSNRWSYNSPKADSLIDAIQNAATQSERYDHYRALHRLIYEDQPVIFLYAPVEPILCRKGLKGMQPSPIRPGYYLPYLYW